MIPELRFCAERPAMTLVRGLDDSAGYRIGRGSALTKKTADKTKSLHVPDRN